MTNVAERVWLEYEEAAAHIGCSVRQLKRWVAEERVPFTRLAVNRTRFDPDALDAWVEAQTFDPARPDPRIYCGICQSWYEGQELTPTEVELSDGTRATLPLCSPCYDRRG